MKRLVRVHLRGSFRGFHDGPVEVMAATAAEAVERVTSQLPGFQPTAQGPLVVRVGGHHTVQDLERPIEVDDLHLFPEFAGGKNNGFLQVIIGAVLIVVALVAIAFGFPLLGTALFMMGVNMVIGGLIQLLFPAPELNNKQEDPSRYLGTPQTTVKIGTPIRVFYGRRKAGFHLLSFNMHATKQAV